jgi:hypothetical protein
MCVNKVASFVAVDVVKQSVVLASESKLLDVQILSWICGGLRV